MKTLSFDPVKLILSVLAIVFAWGIVSGEAIFWLCLFIIVGCAIGIAWIDKRSGKVA